MEQTKKQRFFEIIRFLLVGGLSTILDYATTYGLGILLIGFWFNAAVSNTVGHIVGLLVNFFLSVVFVYKQVKNKEESKSFKAFALFVLVDIVGLLATILVMTLQDEFFPVVYVKIFGLNIDIIWLLCKCVMTLVCLIWNYIGRKKFIFK